MTKIQSYAKINRKLYSGEGENILNNNKDQDCCILLHLPQSLQSLQMCSSLAHAFALLTSIPQKNLHLYCIGPGGVPFASFIS